MTMKYVVSVSHTRSLHAAAFLRAAARKGMPPSGIIAVRVLSVARAKQMARTMGVAKMIDKLKQLSPLAPKGPDEGAPLRAWLAREGLATDPRIAPIAQELGIPLVQCESLEDAGVLEYLGREKFDFAIYLGGGILRAPYIDAVGGRVINAHQGPLPEIRGMNAVEWALYLGRRPEVTVHLIDAGIDTGAKCFARTLEVERGDDVTTLRGKSNVLSVEMLLEALEHLKNGTLPTEPQDPRAGKQYFTMHPFLLEVLEEKLQRAPLS